MTHQPDFAKLVGAPTAMSYRTFVDIFSALVVTAVLVAGIVGIVGDGDLTGPKTTTTVSKDAVSATPGTTKTTTVVGTNEDQRTKTTTTEASGKSPEKPAEKTTTTQEGQRTFLERALGDGGLVVLQIAVVAFAAFLAGAIAQRVLVGEYGGFKVGALELTAVARASTTGVDKLRQALQKLREDAVMDVDLKKAQEESRREDALTNRELALVLKNLAQLERRVDRFDTGR